MALTYRFYRSPQIGTGARSDAFRSKLTQYIASDGTGAGFWDWIHDARPVRYSLARCESAVHTQIGADATISAFSPEFADVPAVHAWLDDMLGSVPQAVRDRFEADGFSVAWASAQTTRREMLRYISRCHVQTQDLRRIKDRLALQLFQANLNATVNTLPANVRTRVGSWMIAKGLDTSWIVPATTTIRQVTQYLQANVDWPVMRLGPVEF